MLADVLACLTMKPHHWAGVSAAIRGPFGTTPAAVYGWPCSRFHQRGVHQALAGLTRVRPADYGVVDGGVAMEGAGPIGETAVAATCTRIMGLRPGLVRHLRLAAGVVGPVREEHIEQRGESIASFARRVAGVPHLASLVA